MMKRLWYIITLGLSVSVITTIVVPSKLIARNQEELQQLQKEVTSILFGLIDPICPSYLIVHPRHIFELLERKLGQFDLTRRDISELEQASLDFSYASSYIEAMRMRVEWIFKDTNPKAFTSYLVFLIYFGRNIVMADQRVALQERFFGGRSIPSRLHHRFWRMQLEDHMSKQKFAVLLGLMGDIREQFFKPVEKPMTAQQEYMLLHWAPTTSYN